MLQYSGKALFFPALADSVLNCISRFLWWWKNMIKKETVFVTVLPISQQEGQGCVIQKNVLSVSLISWILLAKSPISKVWYESPLTIGQAA